MNKPYEKNVLRTIGRSKGRYFAIMAIIALGVGFFSGLKLTKPGMVKTGNTYFREHKMYDFRLLSTYGFDSDEVAAIAGDENVIAAEGAFCRDFIYMNEDGNETVLKANSITEQVNTLELKAGRMPENDRECVLDAYHYSDDMIGKELIIDEGNSEETRDSFRYESYTIVGMVDTPVYISLERGTTSLGNGKVNGFVYIPIEGFNFEYFTEMYVLCQDDKDIYTDEYDDFIENLTPDIENKLTKVVQVRYDELLQEIDDEYNKAVEEIREQVTDEVRQQALDEVTAGVREQMYNELAAQGIDQKTADAMFESGQLALPQEDIDATVEQMLTDSLADTIDETVNSIVEDIEVPSLEEPETYVLDRSTNIGYMCYDNDTNIVDGVAKVFPVFFFLIAALVCSTTMTRMVDDERGQIGTFRALGYSNGAIIAKYLIYSGSSALIGCFAGFFGGTKLFPYVISEAYRMLYDYGDGIEYYFSPFLLIVCIIVSLLCSMGTTFLVCRNELRCMPADLIRPKAPAAGKRILLERITFIYRHMKFLHKVTARNVFRFKKRMLMMIVGIAGCTALVLTGLGVKDSVSNLAEFQYGNIDIYDLEVTLKNSLTESLEKDIEDAVGDNITGKVALYKTSVELHLDEAIKNVYLVVADGDMLDGYLNFNMISGSAEYPEYGQVMLSEKIAELAGVSVGDEITFSDTSETEVTFTVSGIFENYVWHYAYVTPETYEDYFGKSYEKNTLYINTGSDNASYEAGAAIGSLDDVLSVTVVPEVKERVENMMSMMNAVVWLVIGSAGALAFIVLFNLSNINITERVREIATIKVLGFYPNETGAYVFRENLVLTLMGIIVGLPLGFLLHRFVMDQIQVDMVAFKAAIFTRSYFIGVILVLTFLKVVDLVMRRKIDVIDMAESLKSIE